MQLHEVVVHLLVIQHFRELFLTRELIVEANVEFKRPDSAFLDLFLLPADFIFNVLDSPVILFNMLDDSLVPDGHLSSRLILFNVSSFHLLLAFNFILHFLSDGLTALRSLEYFLSAGHHRHVAAIVKAGIGIVASSHALRKASHSTNLCVVHTHHLGTSERKVLLALSHLSDLLHTLVGGLLIHLYSNIFKLTFHLSLAYLIECAEVRHGEVPFIVFSFT